MIRILICCGGGFSSSFLAQRMKSDIIKENLENHFMVDFQPFTLLDEKKHEFDIVMCCPHLKIGVDLYLQEHTIDIPLYILPPRMYGNMILDNLLEDAEDIIELYQQAHINPCCFKGEESVLRIKRMESHRKYNGGV